MSPFLTKKPIDRNVVVERGDQHVTIVHESGNGDRGGNVFVWFDPRTLRVKSVMRAPGSVRDPRGVRDMVPKHDRLWGGRLWRERLNNPLLLRLLDEHDPSKVVSLRDVERDGGPRDNPSDPSGITDDLLDGLIAMEIEALDGPRSARNRAKVTPQLRDAADAFEWDALSVLRQVCETDEAVDEATNRDAIYLMLMTMRGEGVGVWDGSLDGIVGLNTARLCDALEKQRTQAETNLRDSFNILQSRIENEAMAAIDGE